MMEEPQMVRPPQVLYPCSNGRRSSSNNSNSPEFEFWMVGNPPSNPQPNLLSAAELFSGGVLLPLHLLQHHSSDDPPDQNQPEKASELPGTSGSDQPPCSGPDVSSVLAGVSAPASASSKRWKDIFKISSDRRSSKGGINGEDRNNNSKAKEKEKKKEKKFNGGGGGNVGNGANAAELNINIWPFSRSRSAGNGGSRPRAAAGATRKVSSAPCSRSNSASESKSRKWPSSPSRGGVHLGRSSPVWQVRPRAAAGAKVGSGDPATKNGEKGVTKKEASEVRRKIAPAAKSGDGSASGVGGGPRAKVLTLNVPMCIGYRQHLSCRKDENRAVGAGAAPGRDGGNGGGSDEGVRGSNLFNIRSLFAKKVH